AEDGIRDFHVTGVQTCALPISSGRPDVVVVVATRGRPERFAELLGSVAEMSTLDVRVAAGVDDDDPTLPRYLELIDSSPVPLSEIGRASCRERGTCSCGYGAGR